MSEVFNDAEMDRIVALPRRNPVWSVEKLAEAVPLVTNWLKKPEGTMVLFPDQVRALTEAVDEGRLFGGISPGGGKTLVGGLLPTVWNAQRTLLMQPAQLRAKTIDDLDALRKHWRIPPAVLADEAAPPGPIIRVLSYESLSTVRYATYIEEFDPDLVIFDEAHFLQNLSAGRSKRMFRFIRSKRKRGERVRVVPLSGSPWSKSVRQAAHLMEAALEEGSPFPTEWTLLEQWSLALDRGIKEQLRLQPGALLRLCTNEQAADGIRGVRNAVRDRVLDTPGIIMSKAVACDLPLVLQHRPVEVPKEIRDAMSELRRLYRLPGGYSTEVGVQFWADSRELANGFSYYCDPPPPEEWKEAKSAWSSYVNAKLKGNAKLDTPLQVWNEEARSSTPCQAWLDWVEIGPTFKPNPQPWWVSDFLVRDAERWALETGGIVWVQHAKAHTGEVADDELGGRFKGIPYFGAGDERIRTYKGPCAASITSHGTGKNLVQWDEALIMTMPSGGKQLEQLLARLHREGQKSDLVKFWFYAHSHEVEDSLFKAIEDARFVQETSGSDQRVLNAHILGADGRAYRKHESDGTDPMWLLHEDD